VCDAARLLKTNSDLYSDRRHRAKGPRAGAQRRAAWIPGTEIVIPEDDPL
jgi:hypothetical protein